MLALMGKKLFNLSVVKRAKEMKEQVCQRFRRNIWLQTRLNGQKFSRAQLIEYLSYLGLIAIFAPFDNIVIKELVHY